MQMAPVARGFTRVVALLPALQSVGGRSLLLLRQRFALPRDGFRGKPLLEGIEHPWNVIDELRLRERRGGRQVRVLVNRAPPTFENRLASGS